jgi:hypothetical protein
MNIPENRDLKSVMQMAEAAEATPYIPKKIKVQTPEEEKENGANPQPDASLI